MGIKMLDLFKTRQPFPVNRPDPVQQIFRAAGGAVDVGHTMFNISLSENSFHWHFLHVTFFLIKPDVIVHDEQTNFPQSSHLTK